MAHNINIPDSWIAGMTVPMKLPAYRDVLKLAKESIEETLIPVRVARAKKQAELEMAKLDEEIATITAKCYEVCCAKDVNFAALIEKQDRLAIAERRRRQYQMILDEMFPAE